MKKNIILKNLLIFVISLICYLLIISTLNYSEILSIKAISIISFIFLILLFLSSGFLIAQKIDSKGYISGLIIGGINFTILFLISIVLNCDLSLSYLLYLLILLLSSTMGGMFGINIKKSKK